jgi:putative membrane protein
LLRFLFSAMGLLVAAYLIPGIRRGSFVELLAVAVILGTLNATVGMALTLISAIPMVCSFGCMSLVINGLIFWLAGALSMRLGLGFAVSGFWAAFFGALVTSVVATLLEWVLIGQERNLPPSPPREPRIKIIN